MTAATPRKWFSDPFKWFSEPFPPVLPVAELKPLVAKL
jgi:hypothetical protein